MTRVWATSECVDRVPFPAVSLGGDRLKNERSKMGFFIESDTEARYAEFNVNRDVQAETVQFHEKDLDTTRVVLSLSAEDEGLAARIGCAMFPIIIETAFLETTPGRGPANVMKRATRQDSLEV